MLKNTVNPASCTPDIGSRSFPDITLDAAIATADCDAEAEKIVSSPGIQFSDRQQPIVPDTESVPVSDQNAAIESIVPASRTQWINYCNACPGVTFFHTPYWAEIFERRFPRRFRAAPLLFRFHDGATALLPLVTKRHLAGKICIDCSMPAGTYGGWISPDRLRQKQETLIMNHFFGTTDLMIRENPYSPISVPSDKYQCHEDHTQAIDLGAGYDSVWMRSTAGHRNAVRNARRSGVEIGEAENSEGWEEYCSIYDASIDRWRRHNIFTGVKYDRLFFREIERLEPAQRKLWLAKAEGKCIAGILCFYWKEHAVVWHGAGLSEYFSYHPNNYLYDRAIAHAAEAGYSWFDCNPSGGLSGVANFKRYLGAQPLRSRVFVRRTMFTRIVSILRQSSRRHSPGKQLVNKTATPRGQ